MRVLWLSALLFACGGRTDVGGLEDEPIGGTSNGGQATTGGKHAKGGAHAGGASGSGGVAISAGGKVSPVAGASSGGAPNVGASTGAGGVLAAGGTLATLQPDCDKYCAVTGFACPEGVAGGTTECASACVQRTTGSAINCILAYDQGLLCAINALSNLQKNCGIAQQILFKSCQASLKQMQACGLSLPDDFACDVTTSFNSNGVSTCTRGERCAAVSYKGSCTEDARGAMTANCSCGVSSGSSFSYQLPIVGSLCATLATMPCGPYILEQPIR